MSGVRNSAEASMQMVLATEADLRASAGSISLIVGIGRA